MSNAKLLRDARTKEPSYPLVDDLADALEAAEQRIEGLQAQAEAATRYITARHAYDMAYTTGTIARWPEEAEANRLKMEAAAKEFAALSAPKVNQTALRLQNFSIKVPVIKPWDKPEPNMLAGRDLNVMVPKPEPKKVKITCERCGGTGNCAVCGGSGGSLENDLPCFNCNASGECLPCHGTGHLTATIWRGQ